MDLRRFKTILIFMLALILAASVVSYARITKNDNSINREYQNRIINRLYDSRISVDRTLITQRGGSVKNLYVQLHDAQGEKFVTSVLGGGYLENSNGTFKNDGKTLTAETNSAVYTADGETPPPRGREQERCSAYLRSLGVDLNMYKFSFGQSTDGSYSARYTAHFENIEIFDSYIDIETSSELTKITFKNPIESCRAADGVSAIFSGAGILAELPQNPRLEGAEQTTVSDLKLGAEIAGGNKALTSAFTIPVWQVETDNAGTLRYDARNGQTLD